MESITITEFEKLNQYVKENEKLRASTKENFIKSFTLLYFTGCRIGELFELRNKDLINAIEKGEIIIKSNSENNFRK